jgi:hypothetical protein
VTDYGDFGCRFTYETIFYTFSDIVCTSNIIIAIYIIIIIVVIIIVIISGTATQRGLWPPRSRGFLITHNDAPQSVGLLWTSNQLVAETCT